MGELPNVNYIIADAYVNIASMSCKTKQEVINACKLFDDNEDLHCILVGFVLAKYGKEGVMIINDAEDDGLKTLEIIAPYIDELWKEIAE